MSQLLFVYGTLKRGCSNHRLLADQTFVGDARTVPGFQLVDMGGYPGLVSTVGDAASVTGEVWSVDPDALGRLDRFEGVHQGLYRRSAIALQSPFSAQTVHAYFPGAELSGRPIIGSAWSEPRITT